MKLLSSGSHTIAWFKLAEYVARGEKERALSVHKLLMHSVADQAFAYQLEADILLSFDDVAAIERYHQAADLYKKEQKYHNALAVYEHVAFITKNMQNLQLLVALYQQMADAPGMVYAMSRLATLAVQTGQMEVVTTYFDENLEKCAIILQAQLHAAVFFALLAHDATYFDVKTYLFRALDLFMVACDSHQLPQFLAKLHVLDELFYEQAQDYLLAIKD